MALLVSLLVLTSNTESAICATADTTLELDAVYVTSEADTDVYIEQEAEVAEKLATIPGGTNLVSLKSSTKLTTLSDALNYQPGVVVQEFFGGLDQPRLNIRGSGIQGNPVSRGVLLRQDHLPLNEADGSFIIGLVNLRDTAMVVVHRGANSRVPGSFTLGGDINFVSQTGGVDGAERQIKTAFEAGSFGRQAIYGSYRSAAGPVSGHGSFSEEHAEGFRHHAASAREQYHLNLSAQLTDRLSNHSYFTYTNIDFEMPFVLPQAQAESTPELVFGDGVPISGVLPDTVMLPSFLNPDAVTNTLLNIYLRDPHRATQHTRFSNNTIYWSTHSEQRFGWYWQQTNDDFVDPFNHIDTDADTWGAQWIIDLNLTEYINYQVGLDYNGSDMPRTYTGNHPLTGKKVNPAFADFDLNADNVALSLAFDLTLLPALTLTGQWQQGESERRAVEATALERYNGQWDYSLAKLGLIYRDDGPRWFFNISESIELPTFWEIVGVEVNPLLTWMSEAHLQNVSAQEAASVELGVDQKHNENLKWEAVAFRSHIEKELISTASQFGVIAQTDNYAGDTLHQGVELGINGQVSVGIPDVQRQLIYRSSWTYSDFRFVNGEFAGNTIAGVPKHLLMGELLMRQGQVRFGPNIRWLPNDNPVDHENTLGQGSYVVWGFTLEAWYRDRLRAYLNVNNVLDERHNASYVVRARSNEFLPTYLPGNGRGLTAGVQLQL